MRLVTISLISLLSLLAATPAQTPTTKVAVLTLAPNTGDASSALHRASVRFAQAARTVLEARTGTPKIELVEYPCNATASAVRKAIATLQKSGAVALIAPPHPQLAEVARRAARGKLACVAFGLRPESLGDMLGRSARDLYCARRVGIVHDGKAGKLLKAMKNLPYPCELVSDFATSITAKKLAKELAKARPDVLILDGEPKKLAGFLSGVFRGNRTDLILTPRAFGAEVLEIVPHARILLGRAMTPTGSLAKFDKAYAAKHGPTGFGVAEGHDAMQLLLAAIGAASEPTAKAIEKALSTATVDGVHGRVAFDKKLRAIEWTLGFWNVRDGKLGAYVPTTASSNPVTGDTKEARPDASFGPVFGARRSHVFRAAEDTQWVHCRWAGGPRATIDADLQKIGLSTGGQLPLLDRLIKDEIMARVCSIASTKFLRGENGESLPAKSFGISFTTKLPPKKLHKKLGCKGIWLASFGGDDAAAGGRAFGNRCEIYSSFIRRTIFDQHALKPPIQAEDLAYLDGSYVFGANRLKNKRSELIRALVHGYAGAMALTTAHEVGHLGGLGHITGDKTAIMDAAEGAGVHHDDAKFCPDHVVALTKRLGVAPAR